MKCFILCTCRKPELLPYSLLVFKTIAIGFPTADIFVTGNGLPDYAIDQVKKICDSEGLNFSNGPDTIHHQWIEQLVQTEQEPFWICDTDVVFYESVEDWEFKTALAGYRVPEWRDEATGTVTRARLHGSLMRIDPTLARKAIANFQPRPDIAQFSPSCNLIYPLSVALNGQKYFHDTCSMLYQFCGGTAFNDRQKDAYFHFQFGTIEDLVVPYLEGWESMKIRRDWVLQDTSRGRGLWREYEEYYNQRLPYPRAARFVSEPISHQHAKDALVWNKALCKENAEAMAFCDCWYKYCHAIDDLVDTIEDGRPTMSKEEIISIFLNAAFLYNMPFFKQYAHLLFPVVITITNMWADTVAWEKSPIYRRRVMADVLRTAGNEMYFMVALITGGEAHMRDMSLKIRERDWIGQHDEQDRPN